MKIFIIPSYVPKNFFQMRALLQTCVGVCVLLLFIFWGIPQTAYCQNRNPAKNKCQAYFTRSNIYQKLTAEDHVHLLSLASIYNKVASYDHDAVREIKADVQNQLLKIMAQKKLSTEEQEQFKQVFFEFLQQDILNKTQYEALQTQQELTFQVERQSLLAEQNREAQYISSRLKTLLERYNTLSLDVALYKTSYPNARNRDDPNRLQDIQLLFNAGANINYKDVGTNNTALIKAAEEGDLDLVVFLLSAKANVNLQGSDNTTALISASFYGYLEIVEKLILAGADVNAVDTNSTTALMNASVKGQTAVVQFLLQNGADANRKDINRATALTLAKSKKKLEVVEILKKHLNANRKPWQFW